MGLGHTQNVHNPTAIPLPTEWSPIGLASGPLSLTSYIFLEGASITRPSLPSIEYSSLKCGIDKMRAATKGTGRAIQELRLFRESISSAFSSISVLNASFRKGNKNMSDSNGLCVDLESVRNAYDAIFALENEQILWTLGRATLQLSDHLKECPWDDSENLSVFLIVLENPLMLQTSSYVVMIDRVRTANVLVFPFL